MKIKGFTYDDEKYESLKKEYWKNLGENFTECKKHGTLFNEKDEPCWYCWDECRKGL